MKLHSRGMTLRCIIVDDEYLAIRVIEGFSARIPGLVVLQSFKDPREAVRFLQDHEVDLIFLDIQMPHISGIELAGKLSALPLVVFTTARHEFAVRAFELEALDYLVKPIAFDRFEKTIRKAREQLSSMTMGPEEAHPPKDDRVTGRSPLPDKPHVTEEPRTTDRSHATEESLAAKASGAPETTAPRATDGKGVVPDEPATPGFLLIRSDHRTIRLPHADIFLIEGLNEYVKVHTSDMKIVTLAALRDLEARLPRNRFVRIHRSYIISLPHMRSWNASVVEMAGGLRLPVGRVYKENFLRQAGSASREG